MSSRRLSIVSPFLPTATRRARASARGKLSVEPGRCVVRTPADLDANNDGGHAERSYCEITRPLQVG